MNSVSLPTYSFSWISWQGLRWAEKPLSLKMRAQERESGPGLIHILIGPPLSLFFLILSLLLIWRSPKALSSALRPFPTPTPFLNSLFTWLIPWSTWNSWVPVAPGLSLGFHVLSAKALLPSSLSLSLQAQPPGCTLPCSFLCFQHGVS